MNLAKILLSRLFISCGPRKNQRGVPPHSAERGKNFAIQGHKADVQKVGLHVGEADTLDNYCYDVFSTTTCFLSTVFAVTINALVNLTPLFGRYVEHEIDHLATNLYGC